MERLALLAAMSASDAQGAGPNRKKKRKRGRNGSVILQIQYDERGEIPGTD